ncbi:hypothetical protein AB672_08315 [Xylella taiwanensis]|nr:hypothetical protein AB672_08315 [Xylella taiwanensis]
MVVIWCVISPFAWPATDGPELTILVCSNHALVATMSTTLRLFADCLLTVMVLAGMKKHVTIVIMADIVKPLSDQ